MSPMLLSRSTGYPSVLQLLPFSENNATLVSRGLLSSPKQMAYSKKTLREIPILAVTMTTKSREKNVLSPSSNNLLSTNSTASIQGQKYQALNISSDHFPGRHFDHTDSQESFNTKKETHIRDTQVSGTFRISLNDASLKNKGKRYEDSHSASSGESLSCTTCFSKDMTKSLPKPTFRSTEYRSFHRSDKYNKQPDVTGNWEKPKQELCLTGPGYQHTGRIKLNVKELRRSKTPITENDPDKLNMTQVIAFLQSKTTAEDNNGNEKSSTQTQVKPQSQLTKRLSNNSSFIAEQCSAFSDQKQQTVKSHLALVHLDSPHVSLQPKEVLEQYNSNNSTRKAYNSDNTDINNTSYLDIVHRQTPHVMKTHDHRSNDLMMSQRHDRPAISDSSQHSVQRQAHKYLNPAGSINGQRPPPHSKQQTNKPDSSSRLSLIHLPAVSESQRSLSRTSLKDHNWDLNNYCAERVPASEKTEKQYVEVPNSLSCAKHYNDSLIGGHDRQSALKSAHISNSDMVQPQRALKVICLPQANTEGESDEDSLVSLTVANAETKQEQLCTNVRCTFSNLDIQAISDKVSAFIAVTEDKLPTSHRDPGTHIQSSGDETNAKAQKKPSTETIVTHIVHDSLHKQTESTNFPDNSVSETEKRFTSLTFFKDDQKRMESISSTFQLNAHQKTFIRLLNQELAAMKGKAAWQDRHHHMSPPLIYKNRSIDDASKNTDTKDEVKLSLRKERNKTAANTYMTDMEERCNEL